MLFRNVLLVAAAAAALAACGGHRTSSTTTTTQSNGVMTDQGANPSPSTAVAAPAGGINAAGQPMAPGTLATEPPGLNCGAVRAVWVNEKSHVYHEPSDPYYGRTKHGRYMCPSQAKAQGYHKAGGKHSKMQSPSDQGAQ